MDKKNNSSKRTFIPQNIGDTVKKINKDFSSKFGKLEFIIHANWSKIVGSYFTEYSEPKQIINLPEAKNDLGETVYKKYLNVSVAPSAALEFQHFKDKIIEKINSYFGYKAIIGLRIQQHYVPKNNLFQKSNNVEKAVSEIDKSKIKYEIDNMKNNDLKKSLFNLGINMKKESK